MKIFINTYILCISYNNLCFSYNYLFNVIPFHIIYKKLEAFGVTRNNLSNKFFLLYENNKTERFIF